MAGGLAVAIGLAALLPPAAVAASEPSSQGQARAAVERFVALWRIGDHARRYEVLAEADRDRYTRAGFVALHEAQER